MGAANEGVHPVTKLHVGSLVMATLRTRTPRCTYVNPMLLNRGTRCEVTSHFTEHDDSLVYTRAYTCALLRLAEADDVD